MIWPPQRLLKLGSSGGDVLELKKRLNVVSGDSVLFDTATRNAVLTFQAQHKLTVDGIVGPQTVAAINAVQHKGPSDLAANALAIAMSQVGVRERGYNRGPEIERYQRTGGGKPGESWCCYFVYWCFEGAAELERVKNPLLRTGHCLTLLNWAREQGMLVPASMAQPGDIGIEDHGGGKGHAYIVRTMPRNGKVGTVEGNTNLGHSREGDGVYAGERQLSRAAGFIRVK